MIDRQELLRPLDRLRAVHRLGDAEALKLEVLDVHRAVVLEVVDDEDERALASTAPLALRHRAAPFGASSTLRAARA